MLHEVCADLAVVKALAQAAESEVGVGKYGPITSLNDELIEEHQAAGELVLISTGPGFYLQRGGDAFEIDAGRVTGCV